MRSSLSRRGGKAPSNPIFGIDELVFYGSFSPATTSKSETCVLALSSRAPCSLCPQQTQSVANRFQIIPRPTSSVPPLCEPGLTPTTSLEPLGGSLLSLHRLGAAGRLLIADNNQIAPGVSVNASRMTTSMSRQLVWSRWDSTT